MFELLESLIDSIKETFNSIVDIFVELASEALNELGLAQLWNDLLQTDIIGTLLTYAPLADRLIAWNIVTLVFAAEFSLLVSILTFKVVVKMIPSVW